MLIWSDPCDRLLTASANGWTLEKSASPSASVRTTGLEIAPPALSRLPGPHAAVPMARTVSASHARPGRIRLFIAAFSQWGLSRVAAAPSCSHRGLLAIVHPSGKGCPLWKSGGDVPRFGCEPIVADGGQRPGRRTYT